jgi:hypothetical protein
MLRNIMTATLLLFAHPTFAQYVQLTPPANQTQTVAQSLWYPLRVTYANISALSAGNSSTIGNDVIFADQFCSTQGVFNDLCISAAIAALPTSGGNSLGGTVVLRAGTWTIRNTISIPSHVSLRGSGAGATILQTDSSLGLGDVLQTNFASNVLIRDLSLNSSSPRTGGAGFRFTSCVNCAVDNFTITNQFDAIVLYQTTIARVSGGRIVNAKGTGIAIRGPAPTPQLDAMGNDQFIDNVVISQTTEPRSGYGISVAATGGTWITNCHIQGAYGGLLLAPPSSYFVKWFFAVNNSFDYNDYGVMIWPSSSNGVQGATFTGNSTSSNSHDGFLLEGQPGTTLGANGVRIVSHRSYNNGTTGVLINKGINVSISDSDAGGNGWASAASGIVAGYGVSDFTMTNNRSGSQAGYGPTQQYGIVINGNNSNYIVTNNVVRLNIAGGLWINTPTFNAVANNNLQ